MQLANTDIMKCLTTLLAITAIFILVCQHALMVSGRSANLWTKMDTDSDSNGGGDNGEDGGPVLGLLVHKKIGNHRCVQSLDMTITYTIYNVGLEVAKNVVLNESSLKPLEFDIIGETEVNLGKIPSGHNITHVIVAKPLNYGHFHHFESALVTYTWGHDSMVHKYLLC